MLLCAFSLGMLLAQAASAASRSSRNWLSALSGFGGLGKPNLSLPSRDSRCVLLCDSIRRRDKWVSLSCQLAPGRDPAGTLTFLSPLEAGVQAAATTAAAAAPVNKDTCCKCDSAVGKIALQSWRRQNSYSSRTTAMHGPHACFNMPSPSPLWLVCSVSTAASFQGLPAQPQFVHCDEAAAPALPPLRSSADIGQWIDSVVQSRKVVVFVKSTCPFCTEAVQTLQLVTSRVCTVMIDESPFMLDIQEALKYRTGARTVPRVFIGGKFVGGCSDVLDLAESKALQKILREAEAD